MSKEDKFEWITIDLRPFGWGIRDVRVIWPEGHEGGQPGPDSVGTEEIEDGGVHREDLDPAIDATDEDIDAIFSQQPEDSGGSGGFPEEMQEEEGD